MIEDQAKATKLVEDSLLPSLIEERKRLDRLDRWWRWNHDAPHRPNRTSREYRSLEEKAQTPWLGLVVRSVCQTLYVEGYRTPDGKGEAPAWDLWQRNGLDGRQVAIHEAALAYGYSFVSILPGSPVPVIRGASPRTTQCFYVDPVADEWPTYALQVRPARHAGRDVWNVKLYDDEVRHDLRTAPDGGSAEYLGFSRHGVGVCPFVRFAALDLEGRSAGEVDPYVSVAARIDQTIFDRLVVQRFASWVVRTISGLAQPDSEEEKAAQRLRLSVEDLLVAEDPDTKFGTLGATPLDGFIAAKESDVRDLAAVSQTPPHHLLGSMVNLSAEALAAAEASLARKGGTYKHVFGESWEQVLRAGSRLAGFEEDFAAQVRWADVESRSLAQTADALGKLATMLGVPVEALWEQIPGWTQDDVDRAKALRGPDPFAQLGVDLAGLRSAEPPEPPPEDPPADG